ncbi:recombination protein NinB, partial [Yersinia entomophaga]
MTKHTYLLRNTQVRDNAIAAIRSVPLDEKKPIEVLIQEKKRSNDQNRKMWPLL